MSNYILKKINLIETKNIHLSKHIELKDIACPCCLTGTYNYDLFEKFDKIQDAWNEYLLSVNPMSGYNSLIEKFSRLKINSGCRCMEHHIEIYQNKYPVKQYGAGAWRMNITLSSAHLLNDYNKFGALDISTNAIYDLNPDLFFVLLDIIKKHFKRIIYKSYNFKFIHIDNLPGQYEG